MSTQTRHVTADDVLRMRDHGKRRELVAGEVRETPLPGHEHGRIAMNFSSPLWQFVEANHLGAVYAAETGFVLARNPDTVRGPDAAFVAKARLAGIPKGRGHFPGAPDLAVEVVSPSDRYSEVETKVEAWLDAGCRMVVVVNPRNRTLKVFRSVTNVTVLTEQDTFDGAEVVPGFKLDVGRLFAE